MHFGIAVFTRTQDEEELSKLMAKFSENNEDYFEVEEGEGRTQEDVYEEMRETYPDLPEKYSAFISSNGITFNEDNIKKFDEFVDEMGWKFDGNYGLYGPVSNPYARYDWYDTNGRFRLMKKDGTGTVCCLARELDPSKFKVRDFVDEDGDWHDNYGTDFAAPWDNIPTWMYAESAKKLEDASEKGLYVWCIDCHI